MDLAKGRMAGVDMGRVVEHGRLENSLQATLGSIKEGAPYGNLDSLLRFSLAPGVAGLHLTFFYII